MGAVTYPDKEEVIKMSIFGYRLQNAWDSVKNGYIENCSSFWWAEEYNRNWCIDKFNDVFCYVKHWALG